MKLLIYIPRGIIYIHRLFERLIFKSIIKMRLGFTLGIIHLIRTNMNAQIYNINRYTYLLQVKLFKFKINLNIFINCIRVNYYYVA